MPENVPDVTQIPAPRVDFIDKRTGLMSREWYRFFVNIYNIAGGGTSSVSLADLQVSQIGGVSFDSVAEMNKTLQDLALQPPVVPSTAVTYSVFTSTANGLTPASGGGTTKYLRADGTWDVPPGTVTVAFANPTANAGPTAVNGVATTAMRSDAAPAINQTANYTMTGAWAFSRASTTSALSIYANGTNWQCVAGFAGSAEFKMDIAGTATGFGVYVSGTKYLDVTAGNVSVPAGTFKVNGATIQAGTGSPNGVVTGNPGDMYLDKNGGAGTTLYIKESGSATNTGWVAK